MTLNTQIKLLIGVIFLVNLYGCHNGADIAKLEAAKKDSMKALEQKEIFPAWQDSAANNEKGIIGIYEVPEMLSLCKMDSAYMKGVSQKMIENFSVLEKDLNEIGSELGAYQGIIFYNNNPQNFKFECFLLIKKIPAKKPKHSQVVMLESSKMLICNHYGPSENVYKSYEEIQIYITVNKLIQIGPMREFYPISQSEEADPEKRLTRMMVPVVKEVKKSR